MPAQSVTVTFNGAELFRFAGDPTDGLYQHEQEIGHAMWYRDLSGALVNWGVTYEQSQVPYLEAADPNAAYTNLKNFVDGTGYAYQPQITAFNMALRPFDAITRGWGQDIVYRNQPADWSAGDAALAATYLSATAPAGWVANIRWDPFAGPVVQWTTLDPYDPSAGSINPTSSDLFFSFSADLMKDSDMDGIGDMEWAEGDAARLYLGTNFVWADWYATGIDFDETSTPMQYDSAVPASVSRVPSEPLTVLLLAIGCGALGLVRRFAAKA
jgi:hypothetical protein